MTSSPDSVRQARKRLAAAATALRNRSRARTVDSLAALLDAWREPASPWQRRLVDALPAATGFSPENVAAGLARGLAPWTGDALRRLVEAELGGLGGRSLAFGFEQTSVMLAGSIPMPTLLSLIAPLLLHSPVLARSSARDSVTAGVFHESLRVVDPELADCLEVVSFASGDAGCVQAFLEADCVVATGSDETVAALRSGARASARFVGYGHRLSIAVLGPGALARNRLSEVAAQLALDVALWDQQGCLSPVAVYCAASEPGEKHAPDRLAEALAGALQSIEAQLPLGRLSTEAAAAVRRERDQAVLRRAAGASIEIHGEDALRFTVVREPDASWRPSPLHRFVRVHPLEAGALASALSPIARHLAGVAVAGFGDRAGVARELAGVGASRICAPGSLQVPPLDWHHDGMPVLLPLARVADVEMP